MAETNEMWNDNHDEYDFAQYPFSDIMLIIQCKARS